LRFLLEIAGRYKYTVSLCVAAGMTSRVRLR
jgi:hypothetical protein